MCCVSKLMDGARSIAGKAISGVKRGAMAALLAVGLTLGFGQAASAQVTLPDVGVDVAGYTNAAITDLGAIVAVVAGGFFAFMLVRFGFRWAKSFIKG